MPKTKAPTQPFSFRGFQAPNFTPVPDELFDELLTELSGAELKALLYIIRRTFGFKKDSDTISLSQMLNGITTRDGQVLDKGAGLSKPTLLQALRSLEEKGIIETERQRSTERGNEPTLYRLKFADNTLGQKTIPPLDKKLYQGGGQKSLPSPWSKNLTTQETDIQETVKQDINPSNIRNAKSEGFDYVNSNSSAEEAPESAHLTQNDEVEHSQHHGSTENRDVEKTEAKKNIPPASTRAAAQPSSKGEQNHKGGLAHIGQTLQGRLPITPLAPDDTVARDAIERYIRDTAAKLHDEAPLKSSVTRAWNDYKRSGVDLNRFFNELYDAEKEANRRSATIKKLNALGFKNRMAYFFAILEDKLGLREKALPNGPQRP